MVVVITASLREDTLNQIDGLLHTFILPACTDLSRESTRDTYDAFGLTFEFPAGFCLEASALPGHAILSDASGLVQITSNTEPLELVLLVWNRIEAGEDAPTFLEAYFAGLAETGIGLTSGEPGKGQKDGYPVVLRFADLKLGTATVPSLSGAWVCPESGRAFAMSHITVGPVTSQELLAGLERYLEALSCH